jgi:broad specificity phosphatase PhoE
MQGVEDIPLNDVGRAQARAVGRFLVTSGEWASIVTSPLKRAEETANIIGTQLGVPVCVNNACVSVITYSGNWTIDFYNMGVDEE